jgi:hypothetical protein
MKRRDIYDAIGAIFIILCMAAISLLFVGGIWITVSGDRSDPYSTGAHWDYHIRCENGFVYKVRGREGAIQILNSDGTPLRCGQKIY